MRRCFDLSTDKNYTDNPLPREQNKNKVSTIPPNQSRWIRLVWRQLMPVKNIHRG